MATAVLVVVAAPQKSNSVCNRTLKCLVVVAALEKLPFAYTGAPESPVVVWKDCELESVRVFQIKPAGNILFS